MFEFVLALFLAFSCPAHNHNDQNGNPVTTQDLGGDQGHLPPPPPPPPGS